MINITHACTDIKNILFCWCNMTWGVKKELNKNRQSGNIKTMQINSRWNYNVFAFDAFFWSAQIFPYAMAVKQIAHFHSYSSVNWYLVKSCLDQMLKDVSFYLKFQCQPKHSYYVILLRCTFLRTLTMFVFFAFVEANGKCDAILIEASS